MGLRPTHCDENSHESVKYDQRSVDGKGRFTLWINRGRDGV